MTSEAYWLLLTEPDRTATAVPLRVRAVGEAGPGSDGIAVTFRPVRIDGLFDSAKVAGQLAYRILRGEGWIRSQLLIEFETDTIVENVRGRSSELLFALATITSVLKALDPSRHFPEIAATGTLTPEGLVGDVNHVSAKLLAAINRLAGHTSVAVFYPSSACSGISENIVQVATNRGMTLKAIDTLDDALECLGVTLERIYLRVPFRGLEHFGYEHRAIFFGRNVDTDSFVEKLLRREANETPGALIAGPSGAGKSSFLRAGVLPALAEPAFIQFESIRSRPAHRAVRDLVWRPSSALPSVDERSIALSIWQSWSLAPEFSAVSSPTVAESLEELAQCCEALSSDRHRLVWCIDQLEEIFTSGYTIECIGRVARFLLQLQAAGVWILATIRDDFLPRLDAIPAFGDLFNGAEGRFYLRPVNGSALVDVIIRPTEVAGLSFQTDSHGVPLSSVLQDAAVGEAEPLPLLEFALFELYVRRQGTELTYEAYREIGGLRGGIASRANQVATELQPIEHQALLRALGRLVAVRGDQIPVQETMLTRASARFEDFSEIEQAQLERFVAARLLVKSGDGEGSRTIIELAHEALLHSWPPLKEWIKQNYELLAWRRDVLLPFMRIWMSSGKMTERLLPRSLLRDSPVLHTRDGRQVLTDAERKFLELSESSHRRRRFAAGALTICVAVVAFLVVPIWNTTHVRPRPTFSVAVIPFAPASGDLADVQLADTLTEATTLKLKDTAHYLQVTSSSLAARYKERPINARSVGQDLNVRYLIEGSVHKSDAGVVVNAQLIDGYNGAQVWSDHLDTRQGHIAADNRLIVGQLVEKLRNALGNAEEQRTAGPLTSDATPLDIVLHANALQARDPDVLHGLLEARKLYDKALERDPNLVVAMVFKAATLYRELDWNPRPDHDRLVQELEYLSWRGLSLDDNDVRVWEIRVNALALQHRWDAALEAVDKAWALDPHRPSTLALRAQIMVHVGQPGEALRLLDQAAALDVNSSRWEAWMMFVRCRAYMALGQYDEAITSCQRSIAAGDWWMAHCYLVAAYAQKGEINEASVERVALESFIPGFSIHDFKARRLSDNPVYAQQTETHLYAGLRRAGIPEDR